MSKYEAVVVFSVKNGDDVSALVEKFKALIEKRFKKSFLYYAA